MIGYQVFNLLESISSATSVSVLKLSSVEQAAAAAAAAGKCLRPFRLGGSDFVIHLKLLFSYVLLTYC
jgi:hypothetical protein